MCVSNGHTNNHRPQSEASYSFVEQTPRFIQKSNTLKWILDPFKNFPHLRNRTFYKFAHPNGLAHLFRLVHFHGLACLCGSRISTESHIFMGSRIFSRLFWQLFSVFNDSLYPIKVLRYTVLQICVSNRHSTGHSFANVGY